MRPLVKLTSSRICVISSQPACFTAGLMNLLQMSRSLRSFMFIRLIRGNGGPADRRSLRSRSLARRPGGTPALLALCWRLMATSPSIGISVAAVAELAHHLDGAELVRGVG